jgi:PBSX family phage portal protein
VRIIKAHEPTQPIEKSVTSGNLDREKSRNADEWITPRANFHGLATLTSESSILPQCICAYKNNIAGFGIGVKYKEDVEETSEMKAEFTKAVGIINALNLDMDTKEVFEDVIEARETFGIAYLEVIRNVKGDVVGVDFVSDTVSMRKTRPIQPYVEVEHFVNGVIEKRPKKFRKYRQEIGGTTIFFKEIGDPRIMDMTSGEYLPDGETLELDKQANEILEFAIGTQAYGEVRWIGQTLGIDGSRRAENLNNRYFSEGRHTPLMIAVQGGSLTEESYEKLQEYVNGIKGEAGQHAFMLLEFASMEGKTVLDESEKPTFQIVKMGDVLQNDELFQDYLENNRRRVQSAFRLPDLYVGYTTDFNRATAQTAREITEEQVFQPERNSMAWAINNKLLAGYQFKHVEAYFKSPTITNPDDIVKVLNVVERAGGLTPNKAKEIGLNLFGETSEDFEGEWGDIPLAVSKFSITAKAAMGIIPDDTVMTVDDKRIEQLEEQIEKATLNNESEIAAVLKEIRVLLTKEE